MMIKPDHFQFILLILLYLFANTASEWMELSLMTPSNGIFNESSNKVAMASFQTSALYTKMYTIETTYPPPKMQANKIEQMQETKNRLKMLPSFSKDLTYDTDSLTKYNNNSQIVSDQNNVVEDSHVIEEAIKESKHGFFAESTKISIKEKLEYLKQVEHTLLSQLRINVKSLWTDRQSRGKKLLGFPSMEGALMTIAFLTFAVFLIKIVMQFIQGLQNAEQTLLMTLASTPPPVRLSNRPKRAAQNLAAAQILGYMNDYSIKHKLDCGF